MIGRRYTLSVKSFTKDQENIDLTNWWEQEFSFEIVKKPDADAV